MSGNDLEPLAPEEGVERFLRFRRQSGNRDSTYENDKTRTKHFLQWCDETGVTDLNDLTGRQLNDFVAWRGDQVAPTTVQKQLSTIREALRFWADIEAVPEGHAERVHAPSLANGEDVRDEFLDADRAESILEFLDRFHYASRDHVVFAFLWRTGMRRSAVRSLDVGDYDPEEHAVRVEHRPDTGTELKNGSDGDRWVHLGPRWAEIVEDYLDNPDREDVTDEFGRRPLITTKGRPSGDTIYGWALRITQPCEYGDCPHDRDPEECEARGADGYPARCPSSRGPHAIRRGAITNHLNAGTPAEVVSERMDVNLQTLYKHYDARNEREKMQVRKSQLPR